MTVIGVDEDGAFKVKPRRPDYRVGQRVQAHPATDTWMRGDRYGVVISRGRKTVTLQMDRSRRVLRFRPDDLL
jgi:hypothetical protein